MTTMHSLAACRPKFLTIYTHHSKMHIRVFRFGNLETKGVHICMSRREMPVYHIIICQWLCAEPGSGLFSAHFGSTFLHVPAGYTGISQWRYNMLVAVCRARFWFVCFSRTMSLSTFTGGARHRLAEEIDACTSRLSGQNALRLWPW